MKAYKRSGLYLYSFFNLGSSCRWVVNATLRPLYPWERDPVRFVQEAGWAPGPVWTGAENLAPTRIPSPDRPNRNESLYRPTAHSNILKKKNYAIWNGINKFKYNSIHGNCNAIRNLDQFHSTVSPFAHTSHLNLFSSSSFIQSQQTT